MVLAHGEIPRGSTGHQVGRQLLERLYREYTGEAMPDICTTPQGKPYFKEGTLHFSITHTPHHVFCALSPEPVGIDAEEVTREINLHLAEKILSEKERVFYERAEDRRLTLLKFWVLKEAQAKFAGTGLRGYPNHTDFSPDDPRIYETDGCFVAVIQEEHHVI